MTLLSKAFLEQLFKEHKENSLFGKWITLEHIVPLFQKHETAFQITSIGVSEEKRSIYALKIGSGKKKILLWSQMHGNESTGTRALFDLFNCFSNASKSELKTILEECTLLFVPMLNPDGAQKYTRVNANNVDLNRDAVAQVAIESKILRTTLDNFNPHFCFNLHDQRTIFNVEGTTNPATISFLAPSEEETRKLTLGRKETMSVIVAMNTMLQTIIPNFVGRYTDEYYPTATGDNFQKLGYNTILIESGHFTNDYNREKTREFTFYAIVQGLYHIATTQNFKSYQAYFNIPNNDKIFLDVIHKYPNSNDDEGYLYKDGILDNKLVSSLEKVPKKMLKGKIAHHEIVFETKKR